MESTHSSTFYLPLPSPTFFIACYFLGCAFTPPSHHHKPHFEILKESLRSSHTFQFFGTMQPDEVWLFSRAVPDPDAAGRTLILLQNYWNDSESVESIDDPAALAFIDISARKR